ncbi:hypothetical protein [Massilia eburnea]|nr:hypothetical protein [Massilia eburnea]
MLSWLPIAQREKITMLVFFKGAIRKAIMQDLNDIKTAVERT